MKILISLIAFFSVVGIAANTMSCELVNSKIDCEAYFDSATGHKYVKNSNHTYSEYSKKGKLLKTSVPCNQPNLSKGKNIQPIELGCYILYGKNHYSKKDQMVLPADNKHPDGWVSKKLLYSSL